MQAPVKHTGTKQPVTTTRWNRSRIPVAPPIRASATTGGSVAGGKRAAKQPGFPFTRIQGQEEMKLALLLNVVDPNIGGALIMGDRGCGKSVAVSVLACHESLHLHQSCGKTPVWQAVRHTGILLGACPFCQHSIN